MIRLERISKENVEDALALRVAAGQERFVPTTAEALARAYTYHDTAWPFLVRDDDVPVGFVMFGYYAVKRYYTLWVFLIDGQYQNRGYGREALRLGFDFMREELGVREVYAGVVPENAAARHLYRSVGFVETGAAWDGMLELRRPDPEAGA